MPNEADILAKKAAAKEYQAAYYRANRAKVLARTGARSKARYHGNREAELAANKAYREANADRIKARKAAKRAEAKDTERAYAQKYHAENRDRRLAKAREWHAANKERAAARMAQWSKDNAEKCAAATRARDARKLKAIPRWADMDRIKTIYAESARLSAETGVKHHVDHIVPLQSKVVCGLHCEANLRIITAAENLAKHNRWPHISA